MNKKYFYINKYSKTYYCIGCGIKISQNTGLYGQKRCRKCANTIKNKSLKMRKASKSKIGKKRLDMDGNKNPAKNLKVKKKISKRLKGRKITWANKIRQTMLLNETTKGKRNGMYINGKSKEPYTLDFSNQLKELIRKRDNYICKKCGVKQEDYYRKLDVHHIDYNKQNCDKNNLITLCMNCNSKVNGNKNYWYAYFKYIVEDKNE